MEEHNIDDNKIVENSVEFEEYEFKFNFINMPWDDRSNRSKVGIIALLVAIFVATMACVINNFAMHYKGFYSKKSLNNSEINCMRVKVNDYRFVARIHSATSKDLLCVGAVVSPTSILANGVCTRSGPVRVYLGSNPRCKKGFTIDVIEPIYHDGVVSKKLVLLSSYENMDGCVDVIQIGRKLDWDDKVYVIGRPLQPGRRLSFQHATMAKKQLSYGSSMKYLNKNNMLCVKDVTRCPVRAGDLLIQNARLFGLATTSVLRIDRYKLACFADLNFILQDLRELDDEIDIR